MSYFNALRSCAGPDYWVWVKKVRKSIQVGSNENTVCNSNYSHPINAKHQPPLNSLGKMQHQELRKDLQKISRF